MCLESDPAAAKRTASTVHETIALKLPNMQLMRKAPLGKMRGRGKSFETEDMVLGQPFGFGGCSVVLPLLGAGAHDPFDVVGQGGCGEPVVLLVGGLDEPLWGVLHCWLALGGWGWLKVIRHLPGT